MNADLNQNKIHLTSSPALLSTRVSVVNENLKEVAFVTPSLEDVLDQIGPLPKKSVFLGQAEDELPVLLNLLDPLPGPILIAGDAGAGKTDLLRVIAQFVVTTHEADEIQFGVITPCAREWKHLSDSPHCIGIFSTNEAGSADFIQALAIWIMMKRINTQSILLMVDGLDKLACQGRAVNRAIHKILLDGPAKQIWPIATIDPNQYESVEPWLKYFHTRVFGFSKNTDVIDDAEDRSMGFEDLSNGTEFSLREVSQWTKFRIPRI